MDELTCWVALCLSSQPIQTRQLLCSLGSASEILGQQCAAGRGPRHSGLDGSLESSVAAAERILERCDRHGVRPIPLDDDDYPPALRWIDRPPPVLFAVGDVRRVKAPNVAVVGSRRCTSYGRWAARTLARGLSLCGVCVVSGMAFGVDAAAHDGAMEGGGGTIAVLAGGPERASPASLARLYERIAAEHLVISEMPPGIQPRAAYFPRRNRLVAGLSRATMVVEAMENSGGLITARLARAEGRPVFAVPGPVDAISSVGTNDLLRRGEARLVTRASDVLHALGLDPQELMSACETGGDTTAPAVLSVLRGHAMDVDTIARRARLEVPAVAAVLLRLRLQGVVAALPDGRVYMTEER